MISSAALACVSSTRFCCIVTAPILCLITTVTMQTGPVCGNSTKNSVCAHTLKLTMASCRSMTGQYWRLRRSWYLRTINVLLLTCHAALPAPTQVSVNKLSCARGSLPLECVTSNFVRQVRASVQEMMYSLQQDVRASSLNFLSPAIKSIVSDVCFPRKSSFGAETRQVLCPVSLEERFWKLDKSEGANRWIWLTTNFEGMFVYQRYPC